MTSQSTLIIFGSSLLGSLLLWGAGMLGRAVITDASRRINGTLCGIKVLSILLGRVTRDAIWSGYWNVTWSVESTTFEMDNVDCVEMFRAFNSVGLVASGTTQSGSVIQYGFVGNLSRDKSIVTGTWFDNSGGGAGYHGSFQVRLNGARDEAVGLWIGFSENGPEIKSGELRWEKSKD